METGCLAMTRHALWSGVFGEYRCVVVSHQKGRDTKENIRRNFGSAHPEGYRKALRIMRMAAKFGSTDHRVDRYAGRLSGRRRRGTAHLRSDCGELAGDDAVASPDRCRGNRRGRFGRRLGIGVADRVLMLENAYYSVISPEGCAAILWRHRSHAPEAAEALKLTARDLKELNVIDQVIEEPLGGAHLDHEKQPRASR